MIINDLMWQFGCDCIVHCNCSKSSAHHKYWRQLPPLWLDSRLCTWIPPTSYSTTRWKRSNIGPLSFSLPFLFWHCSISALDWWAAHARPWSEFTINTFRGYLVSIFLGIDTNNSILNPFFMHRVLGWLSSVCKIPGALSSIKWCQVSSVHSKIMFQAVPDSLSEGIGVNIGVVSTQCLASVGWLLWPAWIGKLIFLHFWLLLLMLG